MVISKLTLKLIRDIRFSPWMFLGIAVVVMIGIALFDASYISYNSLGRSYNLTYEKLNLADFTINMNFAPEAVVKQVSNIPGVRQVEGRIQEEVPVKLESEDIKLIGRVISLPDRGLPKINSVHIVEGSVPRPGSRRELIVEYSFAQYHHLKPGDSISLIVDEEEIEFKITGIFMSPEYILAVPSEESFGPQPKQFGVMFVRKEAADALFGSSGAINQVIATVAQEANRDSIMRQSIRLLKAYVPDDPQPREEQPSYKLLKLDLEQFKVLAIFFPVLFLSIASLSIYNLLSRMVISQRWQIGLMIAMGFSRTVILRHYISFAILIGLFGSIFGTLLGYIMAGWITGIYAGVVSVPFTIVALRYDVMAVGVLMAVVVSVAAGWIPARTASRLTPAEAIRPEAPAVGRIPFFEQWIPRLKHTPLVLRLPLRNVIRSPKRTFSTVAGISASAALIIVTSGLMNSVTAMIEFYFRDVLKYNVAAIYFTPHSETDVSHVQTWTGVLNAEPVMQVNLKMIFDGRSANVQVMGVKRDTQLALLMGPNQRPIPVPSSGIAVGSDFMKSRKLAVGMPVVLELSRRFDPSTLRIVASSEADFSSQVLKPVENLGRIEVKRQVWITREAYQPVGNMVVMEINELRRLFTRAMNLLPKAVSGILIKADPRYAPEIVDRLYKLPGIAAVVDISELKKDIDEAMEFATTYITVMFSFGIALSFVVLFNATTINILERTREIASLRALGFHRLQVAGIIAIENLVTWAIGMLIGLPLGRCLAIFFMVLWRTETFHPRLHIFLSTYILTVFGILLTVLVSQLPGIRYVGRLNIANATKEVTG
jgi:putative ABC transport system permease protein